MALLAALGCSTVPPAPDRTVPADGAPMVAIAETNPRTGDEIDEHTKLRVVADYSLPDLQPGKDRITVGFETTSGGTWEPKEQVLTQARGQVSFELSGADILKEPSLARTPARMWLFLRREEAPGQRRQLQASEVVPFHVEPPLPSKEAHAAK